MEVLMVRRYIAKMNWLKQFGAIACVAVAISGHQVLGAERVATPPQVVGAQSAPPPLVQIGPGDQVKVEVFNNPELTTTTNVSDDGAIDMPLAGAVAVRGQSPAEAARRIEAALKAGEFLVNPHVTVTVVESISQRVSVLGEVSNPGRYLIESATTVLDLIALAGGITERGSELVYILRPTESGALQKLPVDMRRIVAVRDDSMAPIVTLRGGDSIIVPKGTFFINGQVTTPGEYRIEGDLTLYEAIARAGGVTPLGSASRVEVRRRGADDRIVDIKGKKDLRIEPGDVIRVKERLF